MGIWGVDGHNNVNSRSMMARRGTSCEGLSFRNKMDKMPLKLQIKQFRDDLQYYTDIIKDIKRRIKETEQKLQAMEEE